MPVVMMVFFGAAMLHAKVFDSMENTVERLFPNATILRSTVFLSDSQRARIEDQSGVSLDSSVVFPYEIMEGERHLGTAYLDAHRVRTLPETILFVISPEARIREIGVLSFSEPEEYLPPRRWYEQFLGQELGPGLALHRDIDGVTGATLTSRATTQAARRVLAIHRELQLEPVP